MSGQNYAKQFMGTGFKFPVQVDKATGRMKTSSYEEDISEAIRIILLTKKGERVRNPMFGCGIHDYAFGTMDYTTLKRMEKEVWEALTIWEPRIEDISVEVKADDDEGGKLLIQVDYRIRVTNNPYNLVFPFYMNEGYGDNAK